MFLSQNSACFHIHIEDMAAMLEELNRDHPGLPFFCTSDRIIPYQASVNMFKQLSSSDRTLRLCDSLYHELAREPELAAILRDILT